MVDNKKYCQVNHCLCTDTGGSGGGGRVLLLGDEDQASIGQDQVEDLQSRSLILQQEKMNLNEWVNIY